MYRILVIIVAITSILLFKGREEVYYRGAVTDHFDGRLFHNLDKVQPKTFLDVLKWEMERGRPVWPRWVETKEGGTPPELVTRLRLTQINHASFLLQSPGINILTDPIWSKRASPFNFLGPRRVKAPGLKIEQLPQIDVVAISHNHYDHLDIKTIKILEEKFKPIFITGLGVCRAYLSKVVSKERCIELDWWQSYKVNGNEITYVPAKHWSRRKIFDTNKTLWGALYFH